MKQKTIAQGAEAIIYLDKDKVIKDRNKKSYRIPELDKKIRTRRTRSEAKLLTKASKIINCPVPITEALRKGGRAGTKIKMPFIDGKKLSVHLDKFPFKEQKQILSQIGKDVSKLHQENIIHGDLTTSNMIYAPTKKEGGDGRVNDIFFIDFGLGYFNGKYEDKAVDIHLLKQALEAKHFKHWKDLYKEFEKAYKSINPKEAEKIFQRLKAVEKRGRYKH